MKKGEMASTILYNIIISYHMICFNTKVRFCKKTKSHLTSGA